MIRLLSVLALGAGGGVAHARELPMDPDEPDNLPPPILAVEAIPESIPRKITLTFSPFHALIPCAEIMGELRVTDQISAALILGIGKFLDSSAKTHFAQEVGAQANYYIKPTFRALHVGVEIAYVHSSDTDGTTQLTGTSLAVGGLVGYKYIHRTGFTLAAQLGLAASFVEERAGDNVIKVLPILNLNAGWSF